MKFLMHFWAVLRLRLHCVWLLAAMPEKNLVDAAGILKALPDAETVYYNAWDIGRAMWMQDHLDQMNHKADPGVNIWSFASDSDKKRLDD